MGQRLQIQEVIKYKCSNQDGKYFTFTETTEFAYTYAMSIKNQELGEKINPGRILKLHNTEPHKSSYIVHSILV